MCKDAPMFTQARIAKECLDNGRKWYLPPMSILKDMLNEVEEKENRGE
jgi:hypothetical protein